MEFLVESEVEVPEGTRESDAEHRSRAEASEIASDPLFRVEQGGLG